MFTTQCFDFRHNYYSSNDLDGVSWQTKKANGARACSKILVIYKADQYFNKSPVSIIFIFISTPGQVLTLSHCLTNRNDGNMLFGIMDCLGTNGRTSNELLMCKDSL